jgi:hypothetical protein
MMDETQKAHLDWLQKLAKEARQKYSEKAAQLEQISAEVSQLDRNVRSLEQALDAARSSLGLPTTKQLHIRFSDMSIKDAIEIVMSESGGKMKVVDIVKALGEGGKELGVRAYSRVLNTLNRSDSFERVGRGEFKLVPK